MTTSPPLTLYEYYTNGGIQSGLSISQPHLTLNSKNFTIYGAVYPYYNTEPEDWSDKLQRLRASGLNTVATSVPWNFHQPQNRSEFNFKPLTDFAHKVREHDLFLVVRVGPYEDNGVDFGGLPSWLMHNNDGIQVRTNDAKFMQPLEIYFKALFNVLTLLQFMYGGPIIAVQLENKYNLYNVPLNVAQSYLTHLVRLTRSGGIKELLITEDNFLLTNYTIIIPDLFVTLFNEPSHSIELNKQLYHLKAIQNNAPQILATYQMGRPEHWGDAKVNIFDTNTFKMQLEMILMKNDISFIVLPLITTTFHYLRSSAGIRPINTEYNPHQSNYIQDSLLFENSNYTVKYSIIKDVLTQQNQKKLITTPQMPALLSTMIFPTVRITGFVPFYRFLNRQQCTKIQQALPMEMIDFSDGNSQSYGYISYEVKYLVRPGTFILNITLPYHTFDTLSLYINGTLVAPGPLKSQNDFNGFGYWRLNHSSYIHHLPIIKRCSYHLSIVFLFENLGRLDSGPTDLLNHLYTGFYPDLGRPLINGEVLKEMQCVKLDFQTRNWRDKLPKEWEMPPPPIGSIAPGFYRAKIELTDQLRMSNTFIDMSLWNKGVVFIDGLALGRYMTIGPVLTLMVNKYIWSRDPQNSGEIIIFEHFTPSDSIAFAKDHIYRQHS